MSKKKIKKKNKGQAVQESKNRLGKWERKQINQVVQEEKLMDIAAAQ